MELRNYPIVSICGVGEVALARVDKETCWLIDLIAAIHDAYISSFAEILLFDLLQFDIAKNVTSAGLVGRFIDIVQSGLPRRENHVLSYQTVKAAC